MWFFANSRYVARFIWPGRASDLCNGLRPSGGQTGSYQVVTSGMAVTRPQRYFEMSHLLCNFS